MICFWIAVCCNMFISFDLIVRYLYRWTTKQNQWAGQRHWYPNNASWYCFWLTAQPTCEEPRISPPLALFPQSCHWLAGVMYSPSVASRDSRHSPVGGPSASRQRKIGARSITVNYADVMRDGTRWPVSPPVESIKVKQLLFFPHSFFFLFSWGFNNGSPEMDTASASPDQCSKFTNYVFFCDHILIEV